MLRLTLILALLAATLLAAELDPLIEPHAVQYDTAIAELRVARRAKLAESRAAYLAQLDAALTATPTEPLRRERDGVAAGLIAPANATGLPEDIAAARKAFFNGVGRAGLDYANGKKKSDDEYLKALAKLAKDEKRNRPLLAQIAAEKRRVAEEE